jgi:hypothetical protein
MDAAIGFTRPDGADPPAGGGRLLAMVLTATVLVRAVGLDQPIVENYVGRQVPTAMVARNLERGSGLLRPRLHTAPEPNYFLVEPPLYEFGVVALRRATGLGLEQAGRLLSAMATVAAAWGTFELMRPRAGRRAAILAAVAFAAFPLTIRYGRAFQPDATMLGAVVAGLACWDHSRWMPTSAARRPGDQGDRRAPADRDGLRRAPEAAVAGTGGDRGGALAGARMVRVGRLPGRGGGWLAGVGR